jgi:[acyl-carrier-protein] S-malonyltransferase
MDAATMPMQTALEAATFNEPKVPVIANVTAEPHEDPDSIKTLLAQQITAPVRWTESIRYLLDHDFGPFIEVGHGRVLSGLMRRIDRKATSHNIENENELEAVIAELNG